MKHSRSRLLVVAALLAAAAPAMVRCTSVDESVDPGATTDEPPAAERRARAQQQQQAEADAAARRRTAAEAGRLPPAPAMAPLPQLAPATIPRWPDAWPGVMHGVMRSTDGDVLDEYAAVLGEEFRPAAYTAFIDIPGIQGRREKTEGQIVPLLARMKERGMVLNLGVGFFDGGRGPGREAADARLATSPDYDVAIDKLAMTLRDSGVLVLLRPGVEINGSWKGLTPYAFPQTWRKIHQRFREYGLTNVKFVWCIHPRGEADFDSPAWFPGPEYVDYLGIDLFEAEDFAPAKGRAAYSAPRKRIEILFAMARRYAKPVIIGEASPIFFHVDPGPDAAQRAIDGWFEPYFAFLKAHPEIKASFVGPVNWPETKDPLWVTWGDTRFHRNPRIVQWLKQEMQGDWSWPGFLHLREWQALVAE